MLWSVGMRVHTCEVEREEDRSGNVTVALYKHLCK